MTFEDDRSHGWEAVAPVFVAARSRIGAATVRSWARRLPAGASVLDVGCGTGVPIAEALIADGFSVSAIDAAPSMVASFRTRFPGVPVACETAEDSGFFDRTFDGILAIGLLFLLPAAAQPHVLRRLASVLRPDGHLLFTAPAQACTWTDLLTGRASVSLGATVYRDILAGAGLEVVAIHVDEGENHYYEAGCARPPHVEGGAP